jgi:GNAT superfamily N-acetyltransferase
LKKGVFIRKILKEAGFNGIRFLKCNDSEEWDAARHYRQKYFFDKISILDPYVWTWNHPDHVHFVLYKGAEIIGYAHIQFWPELRAALRIIVIDEIKRNQGLGGQFLDMIEKWLKSQGYKSIHVESSKEAFEFYKKHGYSDMLFQDPDNHESSPHDIPVGKKF